MWFGVWMGEWVRTDLIFVSTRSSVHTNTQESLGGSMTTSALHVYLCVRIITGWRFQSVYYLSLISFIRGFYIVSRTRRGGGFSVEEGQCWTAGGTVRSFGKQAAVTNTLLCELSWIHGLQTFWIGNKLTWQWCGEKDVGEGQVGGGGLTLMTEGKKEDDRLTALPRLMRS